MTREDWIRNMMKVAGASQGIVGKPEHPQEIEDGIKALRLEGVHRLDGPCESAMDPLDRADGEANTTYYDHEGNKIAYQVADGEFVRVHGPLLPSRPHLTLVNYPAFPDNCRRESVIVDRWVNK
jgi:hypothetical protein